MRRRKVHVLTRFVTTVLLVLLGFATSLLAKDEMVTLTITGMT